MGERLLEIERDYITQEELTDFLMDNLDSNISSVSEAVAQFGVSAVGAALAFPVVGLLAAGLTAAALSVGMGLDSLMTSLEAHNNDDKIRNAVDKFQSEDDKLIIEAKLYKWTSSNGNITTYYTETDYDVLYSI